MLDLLRDFFRGMQEVELLLPGITVFLKTIFGGSLVLTSVFSIIGKRYRAEKNFKMVQHTNEKGELEVTLVEDTKWTGNSPYGGTYSNRRDY